MVENEKCTRCGKEYAYGFAFGKLDKIDDKLVCANCMTKDEPAIREKTEKDYQMKSFIISGIVGSSIFAFIITLGITASLGIFSLVGLFYALPFGLLGGYAGYGLFKLLKSSSPFVKGGLTVISAVLGFGLTLLMYILFI